MRAQVAVMAMLALMSLEPMLVAQTLPLDLVTTPWVGDFDGMVARRRIRVLTPYSRSHYYFEHGVPRGIIAAAAARFERALNARLGTTIATSVHVVVVPVPRERLLQALIEGRGDIVATNLAVTPDSSAVVDFVVGRTGVRRIAVTDRRVAPLTDAAGLAGHDVTVRDGSIEVVELRQLNVALRDRGLPLIRITTVSSSIDDDELLEMVDRGFIGATVVNDFVASLWAPRFPSVRSHLRAVLRDDVAVGWAVRKNSGRLKEELKAFFQSEGPSTRFGRATLDQLQRDTPRLRHATRGEEFHKFKVVLGMFRRYADRYSLDYRLMIAQAYQESRLDQNARSAAGAVGIMQLMPETAREMAVGDVGWLEPNIHAGVKYVRWLIDRHFEQRTLDDLNRTLFAFAAYNCGPARVRRLRSEAQRRGLDPNRWFGHVEAIAAERVGSETVGYVSNIYKYYVAYSLALAQTPAAATW